MSLQEHIEAMANLNPVSEDGDDDKDEEMEKEKEDKKYMVAPAVQLATCIRLYASCKYSIS
jgi:hypothetical protein